MNERSNFSKMKYYERINHVYKVERKAKFPNKVMIFEDLNWGGDYRNFKKPCEIKNKVNLICLG